MNDLPWGWWPSPMSPPIPPILVVRKEDNLPMHVPSNNSRTQDTPDAGLPPVQYWCLENIIYSFLHLCSLVANRLFSCFRNVHWTFSPPFQKTSSFIISKAEVLPWNLSIDSFSPMRSTSSNPHIALKLFSYFGLIKPRITKHTRRCSFWGVVLCLFSACGCFEVTLKLII